MKNSGLITSRRIKRNKKNDFVIKYSMLQELSFFRVTHWRSQEKIPIDGGESTCMKKALLEHTINKQVAASLEATARPPCRLRLSLLGGYRPASL